MLTLPIANLVGSNYVHGSVGSVLGAFVVSLLGSFYSRIWKGYAFAAMVPGVLLLVPVSVLCEKYEAAVDFDYQTGLTAVGGLAQNYDSASTDQFASGLNTGLAMIQLSIALTIGLCLAAAGFQLVMAVKEKMSGKEESEIDCFAF